ncbi:hypothetical protein [Singulisphaera sp. PoT]|uniref:hypothetical protein n=1 Tax=Singulisphaera sp. PoT TaxID=3411797 RepID=UPI003BF56725
MGEATVKLDAKKLVKLTAIAAAIAITVLLGGFGLIDLYERTSEASRWRAALGFVIGLEIAYVVALVTCSIAVPSLIVTLLRARKQRRKRPWAARALLLCLSLVIGFSVSEVVAAVVRARYLRSTAVPVGGLKEASDKGLKGEMPRRLDEVVLPETFPEPTPKGQVHLVIVGESSAAGVPYNFWLSLGQILTWKLEAAIPEQTYRLSIVANSGDTLEVQHKKLAEIKQRPDALIIYCGHNEFSARFSWSRELDHYVDGKTPSTRERFMKRLEATSPICSLMRVAADKCRIAIPPPPNGYRNLVDVPAYTPQEYQALLRDFELRLEAMISYAERVGALPILIVPPGNDSDFEPNRSFLPPKTTRVEREAFAKEFFRARALESNRPIESIEKYRTLIAQYPGFAETHYRLARLLERDGAWDEVYQNDLAARDLDGLPMRCPTDFQNVYRELAKHHGCPLIDAQALFHAIGRHGLLDDELFHDGMHPSFRGIIALAQSVLGVLHKRQAFGWPKDSPAPVVDPGECARFFGLGEYQWEKLSHWGLFFYEMMKSVRYDPSDRFAKERAFAKAEEEIAKGVSSRKVGLPNIGLPEPVPVFPSTTTGPELPAPTPRPVEEGKPDSERRRL